MATQEPLSHELNTLGTSEQDDGVASTDVLDPGRELRPLPPVDSGPAAWSFLAAATVVEMIVWGIPYSVGILHSYASKNLFPDQESTVTLAATLHNGLLFVGAGFFGP